MDLKMVSLTMKVIQLEVTNSFKTQMRYLTNILEKQILLKTSLNLMDLTYMDLSLEMLKDPKTNQSQKLLKM